MANTKIIEMLSWHNGGGEGGWHHAFAAPGDTVHSDATGGGFYLYFKGK